MKYFFWALANTRNPETDIHPNIQTLFAEHLFFYIRDLPNIFSLYPNIKPKDRAEIIKFIILWLLISEKKSTEAEHFDQVGLIWTIYPLLISHLNGIDQELGTGKEYIIQFLEQLDQEGLHIQILHFKKHLDEWSDNDPLPSEYAPPTSQEIVDIKKVSDRKLVQETQLGNVIRDSLNQREHKKAWDHPLTTWVNEAKKTKATIFHFPEPTFYAEDENLINSLEFQLAWLERMADDAGYQKVAFMDANEYYEPLEEWLKETGNERGQAIIDSAFSKFLEVLEDPQFGEDLLRSKLQEVLKIDDPIPDTTEIQAMLIFWNRLKKLKRKYKQIIIFPDQKIQSSQTIFNIWVRQNHEEKIIYLTANYKFTIPSSNPNKPLRLTHRKYILRKEEEEGKPRAATLLVKVVHDLMESLQVHRRKWKTASLRLHNNNYLSQFFRGLFNNQYEIELEKRFDGMIVTTEGFDQIKTTLPENTETDDRAPGPKSPWPSHSPKTKHAPLPLGLDSGPGFTPYEDEPVHDPFSLEPVGLLRSVWTWFEAWEWPIEVEWYGITPDGSLYAYPFPRISWKKKESAMVFATSPNPGGQPAPEKVEISIPAPNGEKIAWQTSLKTKIFIEARLSNVDAEEGNWDRILETMHIHVGSRTETDLFNGMHVQGYFFWLLAHLYHPAIKRPDGEKDFIAEKLEEYFKEVFPFGRGDTMENRLSDGEISEILKFTLIFLLVEDFKTKEPAYQKQNNFIQGLYIMLVPNLGLISLPRDRQEAFLEDIVTTVQSVFPDIGEVSPEALKTWKDLLGAPTPPTGPADPEEIQIMVQIKKNIQNKPLSVKWLTSKPAGDYIMEQLQDLGLEEDKWREALAGVKELFIDSELKPFQKIEVLKYLLVSLLIEDYIHFEDPDQRELVANLYNQLVPLIHGVDFGDPLIQNIYNSPRTFFDAVLTGVYAGLPDMGPLLTGISREWERVFNETKEPRTFKTPTSRSAKNESNISRFAFRLKIFFKEALEKYLRREEHKKIWQDPLSTWITEAQGVNLAIYYAPPPGRWDSRPEKLPHPIEFQLEWIEKMVSEADFTKLVITDMDSFIKPIDGWLTATHQSFYSHDVAALINNFLNDPEEPLLPDYLNNHGPWEGTLPSENEEINASLKFWERLKEIKYVGAESLFEVHLLGPGEMAETHALMDQLIPETSKERTMVMTQNWKVPAGILEEAKPLVLVHQVEGPITRSVVDLADILTEAIGETARKNHQTGEKHHTVSTRVKENDPLKEVLNRIHISDSTPLREPVHHQKEFLSEHVDGLIVTLRNDGESQDQRDFSRDPGTFKPIPSKPPGIKNNDINHIHFLPMTTASFLAWQGLVTASVVAFLVIPATTFIDPAVSFAAMMTSLILLIRAGNAGFLEFLTHGHFLRGSPEEPGLIHTNPKEGFSLRLSPALFADNIPFLSAFLLLFTTLIHEGLHKLTRLTDERIVHGLEAFLLILGLTHIPLWPLVAGLSINLGLTLIFIGRNGAKDNEPDKAPFPVLINNIIGTPRILNIGRAYVPEGNPAFLIEDFRDILYAVQKTSKGQTVYLFLDSDLKFDLEGLRNQNPHIRIRSVPHNDGYIKNKRRSKTIDYHALTKGILSLSGDERSRLTLSVPPDVSFDPVQIVDTILEEIRYLLVDLDEKKGLLIRGKDLMRFKLMVRRWRTHA